MTADAAPPRLAPVEFYDWMSAELVAMADDYTSRYEPSSIQATLVRDIMFGVAEFVSTTRGSGAFDALTAMVERSER